MKLRVRAASKVSLENHEPLHRRVPTQDEEGRLLSDFMMLIPGLREMPESSFTDTLAGLQAVLGGFKEVVFADLNVPLNLLWVSVKSVPGVIPRVVGSVQVRVPEALLVSSEVRPRS